MMASWYGPGFHGRRTASGETYDQNAMTAASPTLPFGTLLRVTNPATGQATTVRVNDRGPFAMDGQGNALQPLQPHPQRQLDLSAAAAKAIGLDLKGVGPVLVQTLKNEVAAASPPAGGDAAVIGQYNQQREQQQRINQLKQEGAAINADRAYRDTMRLLADQIATLQSGQADRRSDILQRQFNAMPASPILDAFNQYNQQNFADRSLFFQQRRTVEKLQEDVAANDRIVASLKQQQLGPEATAEQVRQYQEIFAWAQKINVELKNKLKTEQDYLKAIVDYSSTARFYQNLQSVIDGRLSAVESATTQLDQLRTSLDLFGNAPGGISTRGVRAQFRAARLQNTQINAAANREISALEQGAQYLDSVGRTDQAKEVRQYIQALRETAAALKESAKILSPEAEKIAVAVAELQANYQRNMGSRRFQNMLSQQTGETLGLQARLSQGLGDNLSANALNRQAEILRIEQEFTEKILANEYEIAQLRLKSALDPAALGQIQVLEQVNEKLRQTKELSLELAAQSFPNLGETMIDTFARGGGEAFTDFINGLRQGKGVLESLGGAFEKLANRILDKLLEIVSGFITSGLGNGLRGLLGLFGPGAGIGGGGSMIGNFDLGFAHNGATVVGNLAGGGSAIGLGLAAMRALNIERSLNGGRGVGLYALTAGEEVLPPREAEFFRSVRANGIWDDLKKNLGYTPVGNRVNGGPVGDYSSVVNSSSRSSSASNIAINMPIQPASKDDEIVLRKILPELQTQVLDMINERLLIEKRDRGLFA